MKTQIVILILTSLIQAVFLPMDLVALLLVTQALVKNEKNNLLLAFFIGLFVSHLQQLPLGLLSLIYIFEIELVQILKKIPLSGIFTPFFIIFLVLFINSSLYSIIFSQTIIIWPKLFIEIILSIPTYIIMSFWQDRFVVKKDIKLKV